MATSTDEAGASRISCLLFFVAIAGAPFPFGSVDHSAIAVWCVVLGAALVVAFPRGLMTGHLLMLAGLALVVALYGCVLHEQLSGTPWIATPHPIWAQASKALGVQIEPSVSIVRGAPYYALGASLADVLALACGIVVGANRELARRTFQVMAWAGAAYALFGIVSFVVDPGMVLWREKPAYVNVLTATFINRNTAAVYFGACAVVWILFLWEGIRLHLPPGRIYWKHVPRQILTGTPRHVLVAFSMFFLCLSAMFMTGSRAGVVFSLLALVIASVIFFRRHLSARSGLWIALAGASSVAIVLLQFLGGTTGNRFDTQGISDGGRLETFRSTVHMIADHPWFGTGLGTFRWAFPSYRSPDISVWGVWDKAHSTPLELAAELGIPMAAVIAVGWVVMLGILWRGITVRPRDVGLIVAAFSIAVLSIMHSMVDFSLQIPGYSIVIFGLCGVALARSVAGRPQRRRSEREPDEISAN